MAIQTPNMSLYQPTIGVDSGLVWEQDVNANATIIDGHNHSSGSGVQITPSGISINADFPFNGNNAISLRTVRFNPQGSPLGGAADLGCLYEVGVDLYYNDGNGNQVQITTGGAVNATSSGISSGTATASFVSSVLVVNAAPNTPANIQGASLLLGNTGVSGSKYVTLSPPSALAVNYSITLPALPAVSVSPVLMDTSGNLSTGAPQDYFMPPGVMMAYGGTSIPNGWLLCDGSAISRTTYANLYAAILTNYGYGDGSTTFNLPQTQGLFLRGVSNGSGFDPDAAGRYNLYTGGAQADNVGSYQLTAVSQHQHSISDPGHTHSLPSQFIVGNNSILGSISLSGGGTNFMPGGVGSGSVVSASANPTSNNTTGIGVQNVSGATATSESRPPNVYVNYIIKY